MLMSGAVYTAAFGALYLRKFVFDRHRKTRDFAMDAAKQIVGGACSDLVTWILWPTVSSIFGTRTDESSCRTWQSETAVLDCTLGVALQWIVVHYGLRLGILKNETVTKEYYYGKSQMKRQRFGRQLLFWVIVVAMVKVMMIFGVVIISFPLKLLSGLWTLAVAAPILFTVALRSLAYSVQFILTDKSILVSRDEHDVIFEYDDSGPYVGLINRC